MRINSSIIAAAIIGASTLGSTQTSIASENWKSLEYTNKDGTVLKVKVRRLPGNTLLVHKDSHPDIIDHREVNCENSQYRIIGFYDSRDGKDNEYFRTHGEDLQWENYPVRSASAGIAKEACI